ncbi:MAG: hypothetical protein FJ293_05465 [Planctomycetes bacterium]|nr:hypothetical protein [Planctomycetota bacterium]
MNTLRRGDSCASRGSGPATWLAVALFGALAGCGEGGGEESAAGAAAAGEPTAAAEAAAEAAVVPKVARADRLARERAAALLRLPVLEAAPLAAEFAVAVAALAEHESLKRFVQLGDDWLPKSAARGWLDFAGDVLARAPDAAALERPFGVLVDLEAQLARSGCHLLLVPVPSRLQLEPELLLPALTGHAAPVARVAATTRFLADLAAAGVESVDLAPALMAERDDPDPRRARLWLRGNNHWAPRGAEVAARAVAARLREMEWFAHGPLRDGVDFSVARRLGQCRGEGVGQAEGAPPEAVGVDAVEWRTAAPTAEVARMSPLLLLGDSFAGMHKELKASFVDQLIRHSGWPVDVIAPQGGAELACREALARRDAPLASKRVVIWLLPEPLLAPSGAWKRVAIGGS